MDICNVSTIDPLNNRSWDEFVYSHPFGWLYHTSAWAEILESSFKHMTPLYLALMDKNTDEINAALPLFHVRSWIISNRLVSLPYATLCDPLVSIKEEFRTLLESAINFQKKTKSEYTQIGVFKSRELVGDYKVSLRSDFKNHYLLLNREQQELLKGVKRTVKQAIRQAEEAKVEISEGTEERDLKEFYKLYLKTRKRLSLPPQPYRFIRALWQSLYHRGYLTLLIARYQGRDISAIILLKFKDRVSAEYLVSDEDYFHLRAVHLLVWRAIELSREEGFRIFDFGRTHQANTGLLRFKRAWGTIETDLFQAFHPDGNSSLAIERNERKLRFISSLCRTLPNPAFRALGYLCHRHHG